MFMKMLKTNSIWKLTVIIFIQIFSTCVFSKSVEHGPDTLSITLKTAEERFIKENLQLLASRYNIKAAEAQITQTRLWSNPNISIEQNI